MHRDGSMRYLDDNFLADLKTGFLAPLREAVVKDRDLVMELRGDYINVYCKGHNLLKLAQDHRGYTVDINREFRVTEPPTPARMDSSDQVGQFIRAIPGIKYRIATYTDRRNREIEFEQLIVRANNCERDLNSDFFIVDRQVAMPDRVEQFDLMAIYWNREGRKRKQTVPLELLEVKFGQNSDISVIGDQLGRYLQSIERHMGRLAEEAERLLAQKIELALIEQPDDRLEALKTLKVSRRIEDVRFGIVLVDYNPHSSLLVTGNLTIPGRANTIDVFRVGFGLWVRNADGHN